MLELKQIESFYPESLQPFKRNLLREYLQFKVLEVIFSSKYAEKLSFMGGTALHIVHALPRFSEDLDFDNIGLKKTNFENLTAFIQKKLNLQGYAIQIKNSFKGAYRSCIRVSNILYENKLSSHKEEKMLIYLDVEAQKFNYRPDKVILNKFDVFTRINVVPINIILAQKICAIFMRKRPMGRDFYDAIFLLGKTKPNLEYLKLKLKISGFDELKKKLLEKSVDFDFKHLAKDVAQFLFSPSDAKKILLFNEYIKSIK